MPEFAKISLTNLGYLDELKRGYDSLNIFYKLFFPSRMKAFLDRYSLNNHDRASLDRRSYRNLLDLHRGFLQTGYFRKWLFSSLTAFNTSSSVIACRTLNHSIEGDDGDYNFRAVIQHPYPDTLARCLNLLSNQNMLTLATRSCCFDITDPSFLETLSTIIPCVNNSNYSQETKIKLFSRIARWSKLPNMADAIKVLFDQNALSTANMTACRNSPHPIALAENLCQLERYSILTDVIRGLIQQGDEKSNILTATLLTLERAGAISDDNDYIRPLCSDANAVKCSNLSLESLTAFRSHLGFFIEHHLMTHQVFDYLYNNHLLFATFTSHTWQSVPVETLEAVISECFESGKPLDLYSLYVNQSNSNQMPLTDINVDYDYDSASDAKMRI